MAPLNITQQSLNYKIKYLPVLNNDNLINFLDSQRNKHYINKRFNYTKQNIKQHCNL